MALSIEVVVTIVGVLVAAPCSAIAVWQGWSQRRSNIGSSEHQTSRLMG